MSTTNRPNEKREFQFGASSSSSKRKTKFLLQTKKNPEAGAPGQAGGLQGRGIAREVGLQVERDREIG
jgi:hypothetical protein